MTDYLCGADYPGTTGVPRRTCCASCAFREGHGTVRKDDETPEYVWLQTSQCSDFICHTADADGTYPSCAGWHARKATPSHLQREGQLGE